MVSNLENLVVYFSLKLKILWIIYLTFSSNIYYNLYYLIY